jgi:hypothetical protein
LRDDKRIKACNWDYRITRYGGQPNMYMIIHGVKAVRINTIRQQFKAWIEDGNANEEAENVWREQTTQWRKVFTLRQLYRFFIKEYIHTR